MHPVSVSWCIARLLSRMAWCACRSCLPECMIQSRAMHPSPGPWCIARCAVPLDAPALAPSPSTAPALPPAFLLKVPQSAVSGNQAPTALSRVFEGTKKPDFTNNYFVIARVNGRGKGRDSMQCWQHLYMRHVDGVHPLHMMLPCSGWRRFRNQAVFCGSH